MATNSGGLQGARGMRRACDSKKEAWCQTASAQRTARIAC